MKDLSVKLVEIVIGSLLTAICTISAYYLHSVNANLEESQRLWLLGNYRIEQLERSTMELRLEVADLRRTCKRP